jgi:hypothetical protein
MIHYSCDCCKRPLSNDDLRYVVRMEVYAAFDQNPFAETDNDRDHLQEIQDILQRADDAHDDAIGPDVYDQMRFDLCSDCRKKFVKHPLGREVSALVEFSKN